MITFPKINFLNRNEAKNRTANANVQNKAVIYVNPAFGANLAPLSRDTVSFGAGRVSSPKLSQEEKDAQVGKVRKGAKTREGKKLDQSCRGSLHVSAALRDEADFAYKRLKNDISSIFGMHVLETDDINFSSMYDTELITNIANKKPVLAITARKKSAKSSSEKIGHMKITTKKDALEQIHDIIGVRILVSNSDRKSGDYVGEKLLKAVKNGWIKISEIEVYRNPALSPSSKYDYISEKKLDAIAAASRTKTKNFNYVIRQTEFGYSAVHMLVDLPGGIKGEIQIISPKVAAFKEIEDICYKGLSGKGLPKGYAKLKASFEKLDPKINREGYDEFAEYTRQAYAKERRRPSRDKGAFLALPEDSIIPPRLDFNYIAMLKSNIDKAQKEKAVQKMQDEVAELVGEVAEQA